MANLDYTDYDFDQLVSQLIDRLQTNSAAWKDTYRSATAMMLIELFSYIGNMNNYYIERSAEERFIGTAQLRSSVVNLVKLLNYTPKRKVSSIGNLVFTLTAPAAKKIFLPKYTEAQTSEGVKFLISSDSVILVGQTSLSVPGIQGEVVDISVTADGSTNFEYTVEDDSVENSNLEVYVDGVLWEKVDALLYSTPVSLHYLVFLENNETVTIRFGDGVNGAIPGSGSVVLVRYIKSAGLSGNIYAASKITTLNSTVYDESGTVVDTISVSNTDTFLGGDDAESTEEIKYEAPRVFATGDRFVTRADFIAGLENYAGIATANAWGENEEASPSYTMFNRVKLVVILQNWVLPGDSFKDTITSFLYSKALCTVKYEFVDPDIIEVIPILTVKAVRGFSLSQVQSDIGSALEDQFALGTTTDLGQAKYLSDLTTVVDAVAGVSYHHMTLEAYQEMVAGFTSFYSYGEIIYALPVLEGSVRVFFNDTQIAVDDGGGHFTDTHSVYTVNHGGAAGIDYESGAIGLNPYPLPGPGDVLSVRYQQNNSGDISCTYNQICKLKDVEILSIAYVA